MFLSSSIKAEFRSGLSITNNNLGLKLIEYRVGDLGFQINYYNLKNESEKSRVKIGARKYFQNNRSAFFIKGTATKNLTNSKVGFDFSLGKRSPINYFLLLDTELGYTKFEDDIYLEATVDFSWNRFMKNWQRKKDDQENSEESADKQLGELIELGEFSIELEGNKQIETVVVLEVDSEETVKYIKNNELKIKDNIITILKSYNYDKLSHNSKEILEKSRKEIINVINKGLDTGKITDVFYTEFILQ